MIEYGAEAVDAEIRHDNTQFQYMDLQGVERRLGAKTPFELVKCARVVRVSRKPSAQATETTIYLVSRRR